MCKHVSQEMVFIQCQSVHQLIVLFWPLYSRTDAQPEYFSLVLQSISCMQGHNWDFSKGGSRCVKMRVLTQMSCHFCHLLWLVCLKKAYKRGFTNTPGFPLATPLHMKLGALLKLCLRCISDTVF